MLTLNRLGNRWAMVVSVVLAVPVLVLVELALGPVVLVLGLAHIWLAQGLARPYL